jgi:hypothetical protein
MDAEPVVDVLEMFVDSRRGDSDAGCDLRVGVAVCDVLEDGALSWREPIEPHVFLAKQEYEEPFQPCCAKRESPPLSFDEEGLLPVVQREHD